MKSIIVIGGGGHARVVIDSLRASGAHVIGFVDRDASKTAVLGAARMGDEASVLSHPEKDVWLANGIGSVGAPGPRLEWYRWFKERGFFFTQVIHPSALIADDAILGEGAQVMAGAVIQTGVCVEENSIVNTHASIDHECLIGAHVHVAPGVTLSGLVRVGDRAHLGTGAIVVQGMEIGADSIVGAGSVVVRPVAKGSVVWGVPAREQHVDRP
jgi:UDP-perosamine 4-acetyltransferase